jgi:hypothetical protein
VAVFLTLCLGAVVGNDSPQVLSALANSPTLEKTARRDCVLKLFRHHVRPGMRLGELARLLDHPAWLKEEDVSHFIFLGGFVPVDWSPGKNSLYSVRIILEGDDEVPAVYLLVSGKTDSRESRAVARLLRGTGGDGHQDRVILQVGYSDPIRERPASSAPPLPISRVR